MLSILPTPYGITDNLDRSIDEILDPNAQKKVVSSLLSGLQKIDFNLKESEQAHRDYSANFNIITRNYTNFKKNTGLLLHSFSENINDAEQHIDHALKDLENIKNSLGVLRKQTMVESNERNGKVIKQTETPSLYIECNIKIVEICEWLLQFVQANILMQQNKFDKACEIFSQLTTNNTQVLTYLKDTLDNSNIHTIPNLQLEEISKYLPQVFRQSELSKVEAYTQAWLGKSFVTTSSILTKYIEESFVVIRKVVETKKVTKDEVNLPHKFYVPLLRALQEQASAQLWTQSAGELISLGDYERALTYLEEANSAFQGSNSGDLSLKLNIAYNMALSYFHLKQYDEAIKIVEETYYTVGSKAPERFSDILYLAAGIYEYLGKKEEAFKYCSQAIEHAGEGSIILKAQSKAVQELLIDAIINDRVEVVEKLSSKFLIKSADTLVLLLEREILPLHINAQIKALIENAILQSNEKALRSLVKYAETHQQEQDDIRDIIIKVVGEKANDSLIQTLVDLGFNLDTKDNQGCTILHYAAIAGNTDIISVLINNGAGLEAKDETGETPVILASLYSQRDVVDILLTAGANPNAKDEVGHTALHMAAEKNNLEVLKLLKNSYGDIKASNEIGWSVLHSAARGVINSGTEAFGIKSWHIIEWLLEQGADYKKQDEDGVSTRDVFYEEDWSYATHYDEIIQKFSGDINYHPLNA